MRLPPGPLWMVLLLASCATPGARSLDDAKFREVLSARMVETLDRQRHYFPAPDRREEFARRMREIADGTKDARTFYEAASVALASLAEGHTALVGSSEVPFTATIPPVALTEIDGAVVVAGVSPGVEGGGLVPGDIVLRVDGEQVESALALRLRETAGSTPHGLRARAVSNLLAGPTDTPAVVAVRGMDGRERECYPLRFLLDDEGEERFRFGFVPPGVSAQRISAGAGYILLPDFQPERVPEMQAALDALGGLPDLVLDLRGNPGGRITVMQQVAGRFVDAPIDLVAIVQDGHVRMLRSASVPRPYRGRLRVLVDERTGSAAELLAAALQDLGRATLFGRPTAGSTRSRLSTLLPGGVTFHYAGEAEFRRRDGRPIEGVGVTPDVRLLPAREDLARGTYGDPVLDPLVRAALDRN